MDNIERIINMMHNMMVGCSHVGIPFVGENSGPDVELENIIEIQSNLDSVIR